MAQKLSPKVQAKEAAMKMLGGRDEKGDLTIIGILITLIFFSDYNQGAIDHRDSYRYTGDHSRGNLGCFSDLDFYCRLVHIENRRYGDR